MYPTSLNVLGKVFLIPMHFSWSMKSEFALTARSCSKLALVWTSVWSVSSASLSLCWRLWIVSSISYTSLTRLWGTYKKNQVSNPERHCVFHLLCFWWSLWEASNKFHQWLWMQWTPVIPLVRLKISMLVCLKEAHKTPCLFQQNMQQAGPTHTKLVW